GWTYPRTWPGVWGSGRRRWPTSARPVPLPDLRPLTAEPSVVLGPQRLQPAHAARGSPPAASGHPTPAPAWPCTVVGVDGAGVVEVTERIGRTGRRRIYLVADRDVGPFPGRAELATAVV